MKVIVTDNNNRTKTFSFDGRKLPVFLEKVRVANPQGIKEVQTYGYIERSENSQIGIFRGLSKVI